MQNKRRKQHEKTNGADVVAGYAFVFGSLRTDDGTAEKGRHQKGKYGQAGDERRKAAGDEG